MTDISPSENLGADLKTIGWEFMTGTGRVAADQRGVRASFDEIEIGAELPTVSWVVTDSDIDACCMAYGDYHEWYSLDSPFNGRVAPPWISYVLPRETFKKKYLVRGLFVGWVSEQFDVIRPNRKMIWRGRITDKYIKRDREWLWYEWVLSDQDGSEIIRTKRGHVMDFLPVSAPKSGVSSYGALDEKPYESEKYLPPVVNDKKAEDWTRMPSAPIWNVRLADRNTLLGTRIQPVSQQLTWRHTRDFFELMVAKLTPKSLLARNLHTNPEMAKEEGLAAPTSVGPQCAAPISRMMLNFLGQGWLKGSRFDLKFVKQIGLEDFITAKGILVGKAWEGDNIRLECDVWVENQRGETVIVGKASGLVPA